MTTDILRNYEQHFGVLCADITSKISKYANESEQSTINEKLINELNQQIDQLFQESRETIEQIELEIRELNSKHTQTNEQKQKYLNIIKGYKSELNRLEAEYKRRLQEVKAKKNRFELFLSEDGMGNNTSNSAIMRGEDDDTSELNSLKHNKNTEKLVKMNKNLEQGYQISLESEEIGKTILNDLSGQRETIQRARDRLRNTNMDLGQSSRLLTAMSKHILQNKLMLFGLFLFLFSFCVFFIYLVAKKRH